MNSQQKQALKLLSDLLKNGDQEKIKEIFDRADNIQYPGPTMDEYIAGFEAGFENVFEVATDNLAISQLPENVYTKTTSFELLGYDLTMNWNELIKTNTAFALAA